MVVQCGDMGGRERCALVGRNSGVFVCERDLLRVTIEEADGLALVGHDQSATDG